MYSTSVKYNQILTKNGSIINENSQPIENVHRVGHSLIYKGSLEALIGIIFYIHRTSIT